MKYYRRMYTWLKLDIENRKTEAVAQSENTISVTKHDASSEQVFFDAFVANIDKDVIFVDNYDEYIKDNPNTTKCIEVTEVDFGAKKQEVLQSIL